MISFEIVLRDIISTIAEVRYDDLASNGRGVPFPQHVLSKVRQKQTEEKASEAARTSGCPCIMSGYVGEDDGQHITLDTIFFFRMAARAETRRRFTCMSDQLSKLNFARPPSSQQPYAVARPSMLPVQYRIF